MRKTSLSKIRGELKAIISDVANVPKSSIKESTDLQRQLGIDSFTTTEILVAIEQKYGVKLDRAEVFNIRRFRDVMKLARQYLKE
ncbi:MAG: acyl carrier protein [Paludibacteraceae bacterium]|nr:acyl carrier protein [Paludibacteraceae bacterium]